MSTLHKLLDLLDQVKSENPELANKATLAAETLKSGVDVSELEADLQVEPEEEFDDSYIVASEEDTSRFFKLRGKIDEKIKEYGVYMRDHEVKKTLMLEKIESIRARNEELLESLKEKYKLDPTSQYNVQISEDNDGNLVFVKV
tara:strand:+ start:1246 stop:1677 length:432 start_codon:yes stop_codon:yes gene_type:complete